MLGKPARIVNVSSLGQHPIDFDDVMLTRGYSGSRAYAQSKRLRNGRTNSGDTVRPDGSRAPTCGDKPTGILVFTSDGHFVYLYSRSDLVIVLRASAIRRFTVLAVALIP